MKTNRLSAALMGLLLATAVPATTQAMSELIDLSMAPEWPATTEPGTVIVYRITAVSRAGQGLLEVDLSSAGLPEGCVVTFSPSMLRFTGRVPETQTAVMTITCTRVTPTDAYPFTVTGTAQRETITITNQVVAVPSFPNSPSPLLVVDRIDNSDARIRGAGTSGQTYQIETTTDLTNPIWTPVGSTTADGNGRFTFNFQISKDTTARFFRAVGPGPNAP